MHTITARSLLALCVSLILFSNCSKKEKETTTFQKLSPESTGILFENTISTNKNVNMLSHVFIYNGAGVAAGDINNDGLIDLYFTGNMVSSRLYLNKGGMKFQDISESAGVTTNQWATGATMVDINGDNLLDIYVSVSGPKWVEAKKRKNLLFINNGDRTFTESAFDYSVADTGFTTHSAFLDYDKDGYLDLFLLGNSPEEFSRGESGRLPMGEVTNNNPEGFDKLYRNNGNNTFTDVSMEAGIVQKLGYGLGVAVSDLNGDDWPDIYVSNDLTPNDVLYINNRDGTFTDRASDWLRHTSFAGMGIDISDFTNNGWPDIMQVDMMPENINERKEMSGSITYSNFMNMRRMGLFPHYNINTLQMNHGVTDTGDAIFSEIARMAGVSYTNWSWSSLFGDFDNDGLKDIFITTGFPKEGMDLDYLSKMYNANSIEDPIQRKQKKLEILDESSGYRVSNYIFRNNGDLTFTDKSEEWGFVDKNFSYGAAYADLNNDGRLDLVTNNINSPASIYKNIAETENEGNYLKIKLHGESSNTSGLGSKLILTAGDQKQYIYHNPYRGFKSTVDNRVHFGLGKNIQADSLQVIWPDGRKQLFTDIESNQIFTVNQSASMQNKNISSIPSSRSSKKQIFLPLKSETKKPINYLHQTNSLVDYSIQALLPYMISRQGPPLAVGDVNGDQLQDVFIGAAAGFAGKLYIQNSQGLFDETTEFQPWEADKEQEDWDSIFFDANNDGLLDLYVASGGYHFSSGSLLLQDRLYLNYGDGKFAEADQALPSMISSTGKVATGDFNGDGQVDLFVGSRLTPQNYPKPSRSYVLINEGGQFIDATAQIAPDIIESAGMITDAIWVDFNLDNRQDLVTVGEWAPINFYKNNGSKLINVTDSINNNQTRGWWYSLESGDFNNDGYPDFAAGNLGLNHSYKTSPKSKFGVLAGDFDGYRNSNIILTKEVEGTEFPFYGLVKLGREMYSLGIRFQSFESFANASIREVLSSSDLSDAIRYQVDKFESVKLINNGQGAYTMQDLPNPAQISPIHDILALDADKDGNLDLIVGGNIYHTDPSEPRADAGNGLWLKGDGFGNFSAISPIESGLLAPLDVRSIALVNTVNGEAVIVANNSDSLQIFNLKTSN